MYSSVLYCAVLILVCDIIHATSLIRLVKSESTSARKPG